MIDNWPVLIAAALAATLGLTLVMAVGTATRLARLNFPMLLGSMFTRPGAQALLMGLTWHLLNGVVFVVLYALALAATGLQPGWGVFLGLGVAHTVIAGLLLGLVSRVHPRIRQGQMPAPRAFGTRYGARGVVVLLLAHLVYAAVLAVFFV